MYIFIVFPRSRTWDSVYAEDPASERDNDLEDQSGDFWKIQGFGGVYMCVGGERVAGRGVLENRASVRGSLGQGHGYQREGAGFQGIRGLGQWGNILHIDRRPTVRVSSICCSV